MGKRLDPPDGAAGLAVAVRRYAANLFAAAADFSPQAIANVRQFFKLISQAEDTDDDAPEQSQWAWARFLAGWPAWRPHRLERQLLLPSMEALRELAVRIRDATATATVEPAFRRWSLFSRPHAPAPSVDLREVLAHTADVLDALVHPSPSSVTGVLDRAVELGRAVDVRIARLPEEWLPLRLTRAAALLPEWPAMPPLLADCGLLPWLADLIQSAVERGPFPNAPAAFVAVMKETLDDLRTQRMLPTGDAIHGALDELSTVEEGSPAEAWLRGLSSLLASIDSRQPSSRWPILLARLAVRAVEQVAPNAEPPVNPNTLAVPRDWCRPGRAAYRYAVHPSAPRSVVRIDRFAIPPDRAEVTLSLGAKPNGAVIWLTVEESQFAGGPGTKLAGRFRKRAEVEFWDRASAGDDPASLRKGWIAWLDTTPGRDWFHSIAEKFSQHASTGVLLAAVRQSAGVECFPNIDTQSGETSWPAEVPFTAASVSFAASASPPGTILSVARFATSPAAARMCVSLGPIGPIGAAIAATWDAVVASGLELDNCRAVLAPALEAAARTGGLISNDVLLALLDQLADTEPGASSAHDGRDALLARLRDWAAVAAFAIQPAEWTFAAGGAAPAPDAAGLDRKPVFRRDVPLGRIAKVKRFGLVGSDGVVRAGEIVISAGLAPPGLVELEAAAESLEGREGDELREAFRGLRAAGAEGYLELALTDLFTRFWDRAYPVWSAAAPDVAEDFAERLRALLQVQFSLDVVHPANYRDHPSGWVSVPPGTRMTSGRVVRVLRPGLASGGELRVPARVEAE